MEDIEFPISASKLGQLLGAELIGDGNFEVDHLAPIGAARNGALSFLTSKKFESGLTDATGAVVLVSKELASSGYPVTFLVVEDPKKSFVQVARHFTARFEFQGISSSADVDPTAQLGAGVRLAPGVIVGPRAEIGSNTYVGPNCYIGADVKIGSECKFSPNVTVLDQVVIGDRVKVFAGSVLGSEGFGFSQAEDGSSSEIPQVGTVIVEDDVRIGALCTIDRAMVGATKIGKGSKLDAQVHVGHNCVIEPNVILCAQVGLSGSVVLERNVMLGGQVGLGNGVRVGKNARMGGQSGSSTNVKGDQTYFLTPATPIDQVVKIVKYFRKLPQIWTRLKKLEQQMEQLDAR